VRCVCGKGDDGRFMLDCDCCHAWFHGECVGGYTSPEEVPKDWFGFP
jgi:hypothetical protein